MTHRDTPGHGYYRLPSSLMALIPEKFRQNEYEEDLDYCIPIVALREVCDFTAYLNKLHASGNLYYSSVDDLISKASSCMRDWFPEDYHELTGEAVNSENSHTIQDREWCQSKAGKYLGFSAVSSSTHPGLVEVWVALCTGYENKRYPKFDKRTEVQILVPESEYKSRGGRNWVMGEPDRLALYTKLLGAFDLSPKIR
jgi:hypothetical protein